MMLLVVARGRFPQSSLEVYAFSFCVKLIDDYLIIATCGLSAVSGMLLSWKTKWGFFNHWWIVVKLVVTMIMLAIGAGYLGPAINETESMLKGVRLDTELMTETMQGMDYRSINSAVIAIGWSQIVVLAIIMWISVFKPWGKTKWFRHQGQA